VGQIPKETQALSERRNRVVHDPWIILGKDIPERLEITARKVLRSQPVPVPTPNLEKLAMEIMAHLARFQELDRKITAEVNASAGKQP
jgi:hypothetical protein